MAKSIEVPVEETLARLQALEVSLKTRATEAVAACEAAKKKEADRQARLSWWIKPFDTLFNRRAFNEQCDLSISSMQAATSHRLFYLQCNGLHQLMLGAQKRGYSHFPLDEGWDDVLRQLEAEVKE